MARPKAEPAQVGASQAQMRAALLDHAIAGARNATRVWIARLAKGWTLKSS
jgi:hypothetical protein